MLDKNLLQDIISPNYLRTTKFDWFKLKAVTDDISDAVKLSSSVIDSVENIVGDGENAGYQDFLHFPRSFQKASCSGLIKVGIEC